MRAAHSIYFQILGNHGFVGLFMYLMIWVSAFRTAGWLRRYAVNEPKTKWTAELGAMAQVCLIGYAVGGAFPSLAYFDLPYNVMVVLAKSWVLRRAWQSEPDVPFLEYAGLTQRKMRPPAAQTPASDGKRPAPARALGQNTGNQGVGGPTC